jgi:uncharacterized protein (UPF0332 family)
MSNHASTEWFLKADDCLAEARRLHEGGFQAGACSRAFYAMFFAAKAGLKHGMIEGYVNVGMPTGPDETLKAFKEHFVSVRKVDTSVLRDYRTVLALKDRADNSTYQIVLVQAEDAIHAANRFTMLVRAAIAPRPKIVGPTPEEVALVLGASPRR